MSARTNAAMPTIDWSLSGPQLAAAVSNYFASQSVPDDETPYWVSKRDELVARGVELHNPNYPNERLQDADIFLTHPPHPAAPPAPPNPPPQPPQPPQPPATGDPTPAELMLHELVQAFDRIAEGVESCATALLTISKQIDAAEVNGVKVRL